MDSLHYPPHYYPSVAAALRLWQLDHYSSPLPQPVVNGTASFHLVDLLLYEAPLLLPIRSKRCAVTCRPRPRVG